MALKLEGSATSTASLRAITHHISSAGPERLPQLVPYLLIALPNSAGLLSASASNASTSAKDGSEASVLVHKYKTQLSTLLQGKTEYQRWAGAALVKVTVEVGGWEVLRGCEVWVQALLGILKKPDPPTTKKLCVVGLTRIFTLTRSYQTLIREITTPSLPTFISICLRNIAAGDPKLKQLDVTSSLLASVLESFCQLLPHHPTVFRPFAGQIQGLLLQGIASTASMSQSTVDASQRLFVLLHYCAPKNTSGDEWRSAFDTVLKEVHVTLDQVFRAAIEDWEPMTGKETAGPERKQYGEAITDADMSILGLPKWYGIQSGIERTMGLLALLKQFLTSPCSSPTVLPLGSLMDLINRTLYLTVPSNNKGSSGHVRLNPEISREERDGLWSFLPLIHIASFEIIMASIERLGNNFIPIGQHTLDQLTWIFEAEHFDCNVRTASYVLLEKLLQMFGQSLPKTAITALHPLIQSCCNDLLERSASTGYPIQATDPTGKKRNKQSTNADSFLGLTDSSSSQKTVLIGLTTASKNLLPAILSNLPQRDLSYTVRTQIDKAAILTRSKAALFASVLSPPPRRRGRRIWASLLPHLARLYPGDPEVEALTKPRLPGINSRWLASEEDSDSEEEGMGDVNMHDVRNGSSDLQSVIETRSNDLDTINVVSQPILPQNSLESPAGGTIHIQSTQTEPEQTEKLPSEDIVHTSKRSFTSTAFDDTPDRSKSGNTEIVEEPTSKRLRVGHETTSPEGEILQNVSVDTSVSISSSIPNSGFIASVPRTDKSYAPINSVLAPSEPDGEDEDDESDFEIPPITLEPDTDDDNEDDDDE